MKPWRRLDSTTLVQDRWMHLRADRCELPSGLAIEPYYVIEERDWVHVFAIDDEDRVLVVTQYRYAGDTVCVELPGGVIDEGERPLAAAQRELLEETGHVADEWQSLHWTFANPARQTNRIHLFVAHGLRRQAGQQLDDSEEISFSFVPVAGIKQLIASGEFSQSMHIASFYMACEAAVVGRVGLEPTTKGL